MVEMAAASVYFKDIDNICSEVECILDDDDANSSPPMDRFRRVFSRIKCMYNHAHALVQGHDRLVYVALEKTSLVTPLKMSTILK